MKISIITVCFNSATTISESIQSVLSQTYPDIEYIIVDGDSKDDTMKTIESYSEGINKIISEKDRGIYDAMNKGIRASTGDVIGFLNSDDIFNTNDIIQKIANEFESSDIEAVYGELVLVDPFDLSKVIRYWKPGPYINGSCLKGWMPPHPTFYARRTTLLAVGGFNIQYRLQADVDLMIRLFEIRKISSIYIPTLFVRQRFGGATTGSILNILRGNMEAALSFSRNGFGFPFLFIFNKIMNRIPQFFKRPPP